jgi:hypothetical protein
MFAVYNDHHGRHVSQYLRRHLFEAMTDQPQFEEGDYEDALRRAYLEMNKVRALRLTDLLRNPWTCGRETESYTSTVLLLCLFGRFQYLPRFDLLKGRKLGFSRRSSDSTCLKLLVKGMVLYHPCSALCSFLLVVSRLGADRRNLNGVFWLPSKDVRL